MNAAFALFKTQFKLLLFLLESKTYIKIVLLLILLFSNIIKILNSVFTFFNRSIKKF